jgi:hypothetical protein
LNFVIGSLSLAASLVSNTNSNSNNNNNNNNDNNNNDNNINIGNSNNNVNSQNQVMLLPMTGRLLSSPARSARDQFHKSLFWPKMFWLNFHSLKFGKNSTQNDRYKFV